MEYREAREALLRDEPMCRRCLAEKAEEVHHKVPLSAGGAIADIDNLEPLCASCHLEAHRLLRKQL